ncbi:MAG: sigma-70 family RNA polymerase sigma factor [Planctomycetales bacterium]|nr:sigma-70 family RNA polymerase sigma factor [Planctomycetales bacterium]
MRDADAVAAQQLWSRFYDRLVRLAERRLNGLPRGMADEEDIAAGVMQSLCRGAVAGRFENVRDRDDLWWLLLAITKQKIVNYIRHETAAKRGAGRVNRESDLARQNDTVERFSLDHLVSEEPTPEYVMVLEEENGRLMELLRNEQLRKIATLRIEGYSIPEIAAETGISQRSVERKLQLIRGTWSQELSDA